MTITKNKEVNHYLFYEPTFDESLLFDLILKFSMSNRF